MQSTAKTVDEYLAELPADRAAALKTLRSLVKRVVPKAVEAMQYGMPCYSLGAFMCGFASQKHNLALYCCDKTVVENHRAELGKLNCGKSCIRFRKIEDLPLDVIETILREAAQRSGPN